jgi:hypothetical protein
MLKGSLWQAFQLVLASVCLILITALKSVSSATFLKIYLPTVFCEGRLHNLSNLMGEGIG